MSVHVAGVEVDRGTIPLWAGVLGSPALWAVQFQLTYMLVPWVCTNQKHFVLPTVHAAFFALSVVCGLLCLREWRREDARPPSSADDPPRGRSRLLAGVGLLSSALFSLVILAQSVASLMLDPCRA